MGVEALDDPLDFKEYNPFVIDKSIKVESQDWYYNGVLQNTQQYQEPEEVEGDDQPAGKRKLLSTKEFLTLKNQVYNKLQPVDVDGNETFKYKPVDPKMIPIGANNEASSHVNFNFSLLSNYEARV